MIQYVQLVFYTTSIMRRQASVRKKLKRINYRLESLRKAVKVVRKGSKAEAT